MLFFAIESTCKNFKQSKNISVTDEIRRIERQFLSFAGLVPYARRLKRIDSICHRDREVLTNGEGGFNLASIPRESMRNIIVDDQSRILYCSVPGKSTQLS